MLWDAYGLDCGHLSLSPRLIDGYVGVLVRGGRLAGHVGDDAVVVGAALVVAGPAVTQTQLLQETGSSVGQQTVYISMCSHFCSLHHSKSLKWLHVVIHHNKSPKQQGV